MKTILAFLLLLPVLGSANSSHTPGPIPEEEIIIVIVGDILEVTGPNKTKIEVFDDTWSLVAVETNCTPLTVSTDLSGEPAGDYHVRVTTTTGTVEDTVTKG